MNLDDMNPDEVNVDENHFEMYVQKVGRMKYLMLTMLPALLYLYIYDLLVQRGVIPSGGIGYIGMLVSWSVLFFILMYFLICKKNHKIKVAGTAIEETNVMSYKTRSFHISEVSAYRRNWLKEIILLDGNGKKLLTVESNMTNADMFEAYIKRYL